MHKTPQILVRFPLHEKKTIFYKLIKAAPLFCMLIKNGLSGRFPDSIIVIVGKCNQCELLTLGCNP